MANPITITLDPPLPSDPPEVFNQKAFTVFGDLATALPQINTAVAQVNQAAGSMDTSVTTATQAASAASGHATHAAAARTAAESARDAAGQARTAAEAARDAANGSKTAAAQSAGVAEGSKTAAAASAREAQSAKTAAAGSARAAQSKAQEAQASAQQAQQQAQTATTKAQEAAASAQAASDAQGHAQTATTKAGEAAQSASTAQQQAQTATTKAGEAAQSAAAAAQSAQDALNAAQGEPTISKSKGYLTWTGTAWAWKDEAYLMAGHPAKDVTAAKIGNWDAAHGWGNHADAGYASANALDQGLSGKADTSHTHAIANVTGLQAALDGKAAASVVLNGSTDLNTVIGSGFYRLTGSGHANMPAPEYLYGNLIVSRGADTLFQIACRHDVPEIAIRTAYGIGGSTTWSAWSVGIGGAPPVVISSSRWLSSGATYDCDTSAAAFNVTLPASPPLNARVTLRDAKRTFGVRPLTVLRNGQLIEGVADDLMLDAPCRVTLQFRGSSVGWMLV